MQLLFSKSQIAITSRVWLQCSLGHARFWREYTFACFTVVTVPFGHLCSLSLFISLSHLLCLSLSHHNTYKMWHLWLEENYFKSIRYVLFHVVYLLSVSFLSNRTKTSRQTQHPFMARFSSWLEAKFILKWLNIGKQFSSVLTSCLPLHNSMTSNGSQV